jgi:glutathione S-transferase
MAGVLKLKVFASGAARSRRVLWALEEVGADYEVETLAFPPRLNEPQYVEMNPAAAVPAIRDGDIILIESLAICEYVARKYGSDLVVEPHEPGFLDYLQFLHFGEATMGPPLGWMARFGRGEKRVELVVAEARETFALRLRAVERVLGDGRAFLAAGRLTLADLSVGYALGLSDVLGLHDLLPPIVAEYEARLKARPAYQRAYAIP